MPPLRGLLLLRRVQTTDVIDKSFFLRFAIFSFCARVTARPAGRTGECTAASAGFLIRPVDLQPAGRGQILDEDTVDLDGRRGMAAQKATGMRRQLAAVEADHAALRARQEELEHFLLAAPATDWGEAVAKARYLLTLFARTPAAEDPRRVRLIADVLADFERLLAEPPARRG